MQWWLRLDLFDRRRSFWRSEKDLGERGRNQRKDKESSFSSRSITLDRYALNADHLSSCCTPRDKHASHSCNGLQSWNRDMRAASDEMNTWLSSGVFCNNNILGFVYVYYTPWVSHSNEYSSYSDVVHCVKWCVQRTLKIVHCANEYQCLLSTNVVKIAHLISSLATSPLHNVCGDFSSPSMWESSQAASLSTIQRGEKSEKPTRVKNKRSRCVKNFEYPRIGAHIEETFEIAKKAGRKADRVQFKQLLQFPRYFAIENFDSWSRLASRWKPILWKLLLALL